MPVASGSEADEALATGDVASGEQAEAGKAATRKQGEAGEAPTAKQAGDGHRQEVWVVMATGKQVRAIWVVTAMD